MALQAQQYDWSGQTRGQGVRGSLAELALNRPARIDAVTLDPRETAWLAAIGLFPGQRVLVLRRALFGGPLHVRTGSGSEFALDRSLCRAIAVQPTEG